ncbi:hypothetical protein HPB50_025413 [Hyalomma asiaticum]|uniref:Uncharacterized protein n=1 Tax=Hyalomma asiaticum TaxID=266040 RepID=A0ACB7TRE8_HYAAI|nr:hypothetical protein HPB50_025413 [Hyalomma asiaticum]
MGVSLHDGYHTGPWRRLPDDWDARSVDLYSTVFCTYQRALRLPAKFLVRPGPRGALAKHFQHGAALRLRAVQDLRMALRTSEHGHGQEPPGRRAASLSS